MSQDNRNLLLAVVLSTFVLLGWTVLAERFFPEAAPGAAPPVTATAPAAPQTPGTASTGAAPLTGQAGGPEPALAAR